MKLERRSLNSLVEEQLSKWQAQKTAKKEAVTEEEPKPMLTISIDPGSGGVEVAKRLAPRLGMDLLGAEILQKLAESTQLSESVVKTLDEKETSKLDSWLDSLYAREHLSPDEFLKHMTQVIGTIGEHGNTILLGRGAQYILPRETTFRVRIIAPLDMRIENLTRTTRRAAEEFVLKTQDARRAFVRQYFQRDETDPLNYDLVVNTENLSIDAAVSIIETAFKARFPKK